MNYWLLKSEPESYSIDDLQRLKRDAWSGVRNYQARNFMRQMAVGDMALFYYSSTDPTGVAGLMKIVAVASPDATQFDKSSPYYDPKSTKAKPIWECVEVGFVRKFRRLIPLKELRSMRALKGMRLLQRGSRLSVQPVAKEEFEAILRLV